MVLFKWLLKPPGWLIGVTALVGAGVFIVMSFLSTPFLRRDIPPDYDTLGLILAFSVLTLVVPATRGFGLGIFASLLISCFMGPLDGRMWLVPVHDVMQRAKQPKRDRKTREENTAKWLAQHGARPLEVGKALTVLSNLHGDCLLPLTTDEHALGVPGNLDELLNYPSCSHRRTMTVSEHAEWPRRYFEGDDGWRWTFERLPDSTTAGRPNFRVTLRPDTVLDQRGPIVEEDGDGRVRVRADESAPWHVVDTPVPTMRRVRECVFLAEREAIGEGNPIVLYEYLWEGSYARRVCPELRITSSTQRESGDHVLEVHGDTTMPQPLARALLFRMVGAKRFEIRGRAWGQRYLLDADGLVHVTTANRDADVSDRAPERCEELRAVACS